jgi:hypothetical protein
MTYGVRVLLIAGAVIVAIVLGFTAIGTGIRLLDRLQDLIVSKIGWIIVLAGGLWLLWELAPGTRGTMTHLWTDLHRQVGEAVAWLRIRF